VAGVAAIPPGRVAFVIAEMVGHLRFETGLEHSLGQIAE
jgi:hypothetical protein